MTQAFFFAFPRLLVQHSLEDGDVIFVNNLENSSPTERYNGRNGVENSIICVEIVHTKSNSRVSLNYVETDIIKNHTFAY